MIDIDEIETFLVTPLEANQRVDKALSDRFSFVHSRTYFQYLIEKQLVCVNGKPIKKKHLLKLNDEVEVQFVLTPEVNLVPENIALEILYEDEDMLAINKPAGLVVHPGAGNWSGTLVHALLYRYHITHTDENLRPGIVHRLDKETSGVLLAAKNQMMQQKLTQLFAERKIYKEYLAICKGKLPDGIIEAPIGRHATHRTQMCITPTGKPATSLCKTLFTNNIFSIMKIIITTGRTHQIRVHLQHKGCAVLGDKVYGKSCVNQQHKAQRHYLHARVLKFNHPLTQKEMILHAPIPADMSSWINKISPQPLVFD